ncbi:MAG: class I SAM-dependent methyltransferase [Bacteroidetes bacterium]|nr:MAG: class I SAM-dependent methyltransferase [Bacteroidota bacterium]
MANQWTQFWQNAHGFDKIMRLNTVLFAKKIQQLFNISSEDKILDIGCGPAYLEDFFAKKVKNITALDVSSDYVKSGQEKFKQFDSVQFLQIDPNDYLNFEVIKDQKFSKIVVMSVIQYFKNTEEVEKLILEMQKVSQQGGILIIADIIVQDGALQDVISLFGRAIRHGFLLAFFQFVLYARFSSYYQLRNKLLKISVQDLQKIIQKMGLKAEIMDNLTIHAERKNLVIYF